MKHIRIAPVTSIILTLFALVLITAHAHAKTFEEYHTFTDASGRQINAKVLDYDPESGSLKLLLQNGKRGTISTDQLSADNYTYLDRWQELKPYFSNKYLEIGVSLTSGKWAHSGSSNKDHEKKSNEFEISLINHGNTTLTNLYVEYCTYRNKKDRPHKKKYLTQNTASIEIGDLDSGREFDATRRASSYRKSDFLNEVVGARFRFKAPMPFGTILVREICVPGPLPLDIYPWQKSQKELENEKELLPSPTDYPDKEMTKADAEHIVEQYIDAWKKNDFVAWKVLLSPMHPGDPKLARSYFQGVQKRNDRIKILATKGLNVKVQVTNTKGTETEGWIQLHSSGHIKYTPFVFRHPVNSALLYLPQLVHKSFRHSSFQRIRELNIPTFDYDVDADIKNWDSNTKRILDWLRENGATYDVSEPKVFFPEEKLESLTKWTDANIEFQKRLSSEN